jgi:uncharacterized membrane protein
MHMQRDEEPEACNSPIAWERRVFAVALVWSVPGLLFGALAGSVLAGLGVWFEIPVALGWVAGVIAGGCIEGLDW